MSMDRFLKILKFMYLRKWIVLNDKTNFIEIFELNEFLEKFGSCV